MRVILLGPPGAGKGTQADALSVRLGAVKISTGDMLRAAVEQGSDLGKKTKSFLSEGALVPDDLMVALVQERVGRQDCKDGFLLDGFPRTLTQAEALVNANVQMQYVLHLDVPPNEIVQRLSGRRLHPASGRIYHILHKPPQIPNTDDVTNEPLVQREDDKEETIKKRLAVYEENTLPLVAFYQSQDSEGQLKYIKVSGTGEAEEITRSLLKEINN